MVNSGVSSRVFQRWLSPPLVGRWEEISAALEGGTVEWPTRTAAERESAAAAVAALAGHGGLAAVSKVLAALHPEAVPLMDDAALWYAKEAVPCPASADSPAAGPEWFLPMLDWFAAAVEGARDALTDLARDYPLAPLDAAQVFDRLVWFESWGFRHSHARPGRRWWWVGAGDRQAIVPIEAEPPDRPLSERVDLDILQAGTWRDEALSALDAAFDGAGAWLTNRWTSRVILPILRPVGLSRPPPPRRCAVSAHRAHPRRALQRSAALIGEGGMATVYRGDAGRRAARRRGQGHERAPRSGLDVREALPAARRRRRRA